MSYSQSVPGSALQTVLYSYKLISQTEPHFHLAAAGAHVHDDDAGCA